MNACDIIVACSTWNEPFNLTITEAMAYSKAIIASNVAGHLEQLVNEKHGLLYAPNDVPALVNLLNRLIRDESLRNNLGTRAKARYLENFTGSLMAEKYKKVYVS